jgi:hypothetical protein
MSVKAGSAMSAVEEVAEVIFVAVRAALYGAAAHCQEGFVELAVSGLAPMYPASGAFSLPLKIRPSSLGGLSQANQLAPLAGKRLVIARSAPK